MPTDNEQLYQQRLKRYTTALRNGKPDCVPIRPFVAEFVARYAGYTCQQVTQDFNLAFEATLKTCAGFDWDAAVANMVYVWGGIAQAVGLKYYAIPGVGLSPGTGFQYLEPPENQSWMQADEYDQLIADPTAYLYNTWLPRVSTVVAKPGEPATYRSNVALVTAGMALMSYFGAFPAQVQRMRTEAGMPSAIAGILKSPFDILADKFRGYMGLCEDLVDQPDKVKKAAEALMPHMYHVALTSSDPTGTLPIGFWMHRGCVPLVTPETFDTIFWPTLKPIILELHKQGRQVLFYAEGKWKHHLKTFLELPEGSIIFHCDRDDIFEVHRVLHHKFAISGGIDNYMLAFKRPADVRQRVKEVIQGCAKDGGFILDAGAIIQNDATVENMQALTQAARDFGQY
jgi:methoxylated aromatic compound---corrinoid protein Co-methyltransferase